MLSVWKTLVDELEAGRRAFMVLVTDSTKGSPGTAGCFLLLTESGKQLGTIGGGVMEQSLLRTGRDALVRGVFTRKIQTLYHREASESQASGLICGGSQTNLLALVEPTELPIMKSIVESMISHTPGVLTISLESWEFESGRESAKAIWVDEVEGRWRVCVSTFNRRRVAIFGGGHCGAALVRQMRCLNYAITLVEPRQKLFTLSNLDDARILQPQKYAAAASLIDHPEKTFAVVLTASFVEDVDALSGILRCPFPYIGTMGSAPKLEKICESLFTMGFDEKDWDRITAPAGMAIESDTPEEIAVSISAQILHEAHGLGLK